ncbi:MAG: pentapeptide repeat-containing protein [Acidimicrobiales bacterium]|nr:pentapeptide repeat-containing protein [Acidimicrobiales bacterium]
MEVNGYMIEPEARLRRADLAGAVLVGANLAGAYLVGANLSCANLAGADLTGAVADGLTIWPEGFDPVAAGVTFE